MISKSFDFEGNPLFCEAIKTLNDMNVFSEEKTLINQFVHLLAKDCDQAKKEAQQAVWNGESEKKVEKIELYVQCRSLLVIKLGKSGLLTKEIISILIKQSPTCVYDAVGTKNIHLSYLYLVSEEAKNSTHLKLINTEKLIESWRSLLVEYAENKNSRETTEKILTVIGDEIFKRMKEKQSAVRAKTGHVFVSTDLDLENKALACITQLIKGEIQVENFKSNSDYESARMILLNDHYKEFTNPVVNLLKTLPEKASTFYQKNILSSKSMV